MSQITTHVLDTSKGKPAAGIQIVLEELDKDHKWTTRGKGETNSDGRVSDLLQPEVRLDPGTYRLLFGTGVYFKKQSVSCFYPSVIIIFEVTDHSHYHVPLLLNPFGYSTYRGS